MKVVATVVGVKVAVKVASSVHLWPVRKRSDAHQGRTRKAGRVDSRRQRVPGGDGIDGGSEAPKRLTDGRARHGRLLLAARHASWRNSRLSCLPSGIGPCPRKSLKILSSARPVLIPGSVGLLRHLIDGCHT